MTNELQKTFDGELVPVKRFLSGDMVFCVDTEREIEFSLAFEDMNGEFFENKDSLTESLVEAVREEIKNVEQWANDYATDNDDYASGYFYIVSEVNTSSKVREWLEDNTDFSDADDFDGIVEYLNENLDSDDCEAEYNSSDYGGYSGSGCSLWGFKIQENEEQIDVTNHDVMNELHKQGRLDDILDHLDNEFYISRSQRRVKNEETGRYEPVGRKTYGADSDYPTLEIHTYPGGGWDFVVPAERMNELVEEYLASRTVWTEFDMDKDDYEADGYDVDKMESDYTDGKFFLSNLDEYEK